LPPAAAHFEVRPTPVDPESPLPRSGGESLVMPEEAPAAGPSAAAGESAPPRRRSTVRERAPVFGDQGSAPPSTPQPEPIAPAVVPVTEGAATPVDESKPRRTGWWSRRA
jgi:ribonuclease E